jgi:hypothetical protein
MKNQLIALIPSHRSFTYLHRTNFAYPDQSIEILTHGDER